MAREELLSPTEHDDEVVEEPGLRPRTLAEFVVRREDYVGRTVP